MSIINSLNKVFSLNGAKVEIKILNFSRYFYITTIITFNVHLVSRLAGRSKDRILAEARLSTLVHTDPGAHFTSEMGTGSFSWVERPGRGADHPPPSSAEVNERVELYFYALSGFSWPFLG
jgi:hypothetical protein